MHQPDGDNIITDDNGDSWFQDGPPASTLKASTLNALTHELLNVLKAYGITPKNSGNDTYDQIAGALIARDQGKTREASIVIASSDSDENARLTADIVISTAEDAAVILNAQMVALSAIGGGKVFLRKGTYNSPSGIPIFIRAEIKFQGEGPATVITTSVHVAASSSATCEVSDFTVYSNSAIVKGSLTSAMRFANITVKGDNRLSVNGFENARNLLNCKVENLSSVSTGGKYAFMTCFDLANCASYGYDVGFFDCIRVSNCNSVGNGSVYSGTDDVGFLACNYVSNCYSEKHNIGFYQCSHISVGIVSGGSSNSASGAVGFLQCNGVNNCGVFFCISALAYKNCHGFVMNKSQNNLSTFTSCTPEWGSSANAAADTAAGGWNVAV